MKSGLKVLAIGATAGLLLAACNKEKRVTRWLEGTWTINEYRLDYDGNTDVHNNAGTMTFNENGSGGATLIFPDDTNTVSFTWTNTEDMVETSDDGETTVWMLEESSKDNMILKQQPADPTDDVTTRIMWLQGEENGLNRGRNIDSYKRFVKISCLSTPHSRRRGYRKVTAHAQRVKISGNFHGSL